MAAFDECFEQIHDCIEIDVFTSKCVSAGILDSSPITGASIYQPNNEKKGLVLPLIRKNIALNGTPIFLKMVRVLEGMAHSQQLAADLKGMSKSADCYNYIRIVMYYIHVYTM